MGIGSTDIIGALLAALSGVVVALFTHYLSLLKEAARERRLQLNTRALLALEVSSNRNALAAFWMMVNALGAKAHAPESGEGERAERAQDDSPEHLAGMYANALATYTLPVFSTVRWDGIEPRTVAALNASEISSLDGLYRALHDVTDLYARVVTITPDNWAELRKNAGGRFWDHDLARERHSLFVRLQATVARVLDAPNPLTDPLPQK